MLSINHAKLFAELEWEYRKAKAIEAGPDAWKRTQPLLLIGPSGAGKSQTAMEYLKTRERGLYFSFKNVSSHLALKLFTDMHPEIFTECSSWDDYFYQLDESLGHRFYSSLVFDDVDFSTMDESFKTSLQYFLDRHKSRNVFVILICRRAPEDRTDYVPYYLSPMTLGEMGKAFPKYSDIDKLRLAALTDALPGLIKHFDPKVSLKNNLAMLIDGSDFFSFAEKRYKDVFRTPESYSALLHGMAIGKHRLTELSDYSGYPPNKTDKYLKALIDADFVSAREIDSSDGRTRRGYYIKSSYMDLWVRYSLNGFDVDADKLAERMLSRVDTEYIPVFFKRLCNIWIKKHASKLYGHSIILDDAECLNQTVEGITFDLVQRDGDRMLFIKIWDDMAETHGADDFADIERVVSSVNKFYDTQIVLCSISRFRESMWKHTKNYANVHLMELRFMMTGDVRWGAIEHC